MKTNKAFSIIELMIVVAIIGIVMSIAVPAYNVYQTRARVQYIFQALLSIAKQVSIAVQETGTKDFNNVSSFTGGGFSQPDIPYIFYGNGPISSIPVSSSIWQIRCYNQNTGLVPSGNFMSVVLTMDNDGNISTCCGVREGSSAAGYLQFFPSGCNKACPCPGCPGG